MALPFLLSFIINLLRLASITFLFISYLRRRNIEQRAEVLQDLFDSELAALVDSQAKLDILQQELIKAVLRADGSDMDVGSAPNLMYKQPEDVASPSPSPSWESDGFPACSYATGWAFPETQIKEVREVKDDKNRNNQCRAKSAAGHRPGSNYHVFLSFRGVDTRNNFVGHLYKALDRHGIYTFKDDVKLKRGKLISPEILKAIQDSRFSIVVLSDNYATSSWCLDELVKIIECMDKFGHTVVPIFYGVDPSHVKKQTGSFAKAFADHAKGFTKEREKVLRWREALSRVATISGWDSRDRDESMLIEQIVGDISNRLFSESSSDDSKLVGMGFHIQQMNSLLCIDSDDVNMVGIWGMGGVGKTTIARAIYNRLSCLYEGRCFISNVKDIFKKHDPTFLQEKLLSEILFERNLNVRTLGGGFNVIKERLSHKKVFIVLDDVDKLEQLEALAGMHDWFGPGSRIIITTRDRHLLVTHGVNCRYDVENLKDDDACQLFKQYAFKQHQPTAKYSKLSNDFVSYTEGLPLALKVLGSFLYGKSIIEWEDELNKLQRFPNVEIQNVLRISYDGLDDKQKNIFLDIACFFQGEDKDFTTEMLDSCGFFAKTGLRVLIDKSLVIVSDNKLWVHDLLQEVGWEVVRQESVKEPGKRSRLWDAKDVYDVLKNNTGTDMVEGIFLDTSKIKELHLNSDSFKRMYNLRLLKVYSSDYYLDFEENCKVHFPQGLESLSDELRYLYWHRYPLKSLPSNFHPENLVELSMRYSNLEQLSEGVVHLTKLKRINLSHSQQLKETTDLSRARNLECIILEGCTSLLKVHSSIQYLSKLIVLNLKNCKNLVSPPETARLESLTNLTLFGCSNIQKSSEIPRNLKRLCLDWTSIKELPPSIEYAHNLVTISLENCKFLASLPNSFCNLKSLESLTLSGCSKLSNLPEKFWDLTSLKKLKAEEIGIKLLPSVEYAQSHSLVTFNLKNCKFLESLPNSFCNLTSLKSLTLSGCSKLSKLPENFGDLTSLENLEAEKIGIKLLPSSIKRLRRLECLSLRGCKGEDSTGLLVPPLRFCFLRHLFLADCNLFEVPQDLGFLSSLKELDLNRNRFEIIPESIEQLSHLRILLLRECKRLRSIPRLPQSITKLDAHSCTSLETVSKSNNSLCDCNFSNCFRLNQNARGSIMAQQKFQVAANVSSRFWTEGISHIPMSFFYPGSEIPEWFTDQEMGSSLTIQLPLHSTSRCTGFAVCAVVAFEDYCDNVYFSMRCSFCPNILDDEIDEETDDEMDDETDDELDNGRGSHPLIISGGHCIRDDRLWWKYDMMQVVHLGSEEEPKEDHVWLGYVFPFKNRRSADVCHEGSIKFSITSRHISWRPSYRCEVKKCGLRPLYPVQTKK